MFRFIAISIPFQPSVFAADGASITQSSVGTTEPVYPAQAYAPGYEPGQTVAVEQVAPPAIAPEVAVEIEQAAEPEQVLAAEELQPEQPPLEQVLAAEEALQPEQPPLDHFQLVVMGNPARWQSRPNSWRNLRSCSRKID